jgi:hypothetical protein
MCPILDQSTNLRIMPTSAHDATISHDELCEKPQACQCAAREAGWVAREGLLLAENEWIARIVTGTPTDTPLGRGPEWQAKWDAFIDRKRALLAYIEATI